MTMISLYSNSPPDLNPLEHLWDVMEWDHWCAADKSAATVMLFCQYGRKTV